MQIVTREDCVETATPSLARKTRLRLLAQKGIRREYGFTVDSLCGNPLCICDEHGLPSMEGVHQADQVERIRQEIGGGEGTWADETLRTVLA